MSKLLLGGENGLEVIVEFVSLQTIYMATKTGA